MFIASANVYFPKLRKERNVGCRSYGAWRNSSATNYKHFAPLGLRGLPATEIKGQESTKIELGIALTAGLLVLLFTLTACNRNESLPKPDSKEYRDLVSAFYVGLAGLQTGEDVRAKEKLTLATQVAPGEPASWANLGLLAVRQQEFDVAYENTEKARSLAPDNSQIEALLGQIESRRGKLPEAIAHLKKAVELDGKNLKALYSLAQETERQGEATSDAGAQKLLEQILGLQPDNLTVLLDVTRLAAKRDDGEALKKTAVKLAEKSAAWPDEAKQQMSTLQQTANSGNPRAAAPLVAFLRNVLLRVPDYRQSFNAVKTPAEFVGDPFLKFIKLPSPSSQPAPPDTAMTFEMQAIVGTQSEVQSAIGAIQLKSEWPPVIYQVSKRGLRFIGGATHEYTGGARGFLPSANSILAVDLNYDFNPDLVMVGDGGLKIYQHDGAGKFGDITNRLQLLDNTLNASYWGVWALDVDLDGDQDVVLGSFDKAPLVLRNNGDGSFKEIQPFKAITGLLSFASADIDGDGDPDVALLDKEDVLHVFMNERLGQYLERPLSQAATGFSDLTSADINADGYVDFVALKIDRTVLRVSLGERADGLKVDELIPGIKKHNLDADDVISYRPYGLLVADLDNSGSLDLIVDGEIWLGDSQGKFQQLDKPVSLMKPVAADINNDGRIDLLGLTEGLTAESPLRPVSLINRGTKNYHFQTIRTRAAQSTGDQRINSFGIGGEIEIRSGLLTQKQIITSPVLHFGLGENTQTDVARIVWPNGAVQAEFELKANQSVLAEQRLKGSCPTLFAWDGKQMSFIKDCSPWNPALGLHVNAQTVANVEQTEEWFKIRGDQLAPRDGVYDLRVTGELWEAFYIDQYSLMAVDHPPGTEVFTDERFRVPQPKPQLYITATPKPFAAARDDRGQDVSAVVGALDEQYLDTFGRGQYQGVTRDHWVELELSPDAPRDKPLYLIGHGWLHPTDATINIAIGQNSTPPPQGLTLEVPDARGDWVTAQSGLGFLSGKLKTMVIDLDGVFRAGAPRKLRLRTNLEIYWDKLEWAEAAPSDQVRIQQMDAASAELRYRGFSRFTQANASSPELPDYNRLEGTAPKWRDLAGYYTRYGDVRELLAKTDDRMLLMNAGDELRLMFRALPAPPADWTRDFVMVGDGWTKDGDYNCIHAATVLPLPFHGIRDYNTVPTRLEDNPAYKRHPQDWRDYHSRYVTPDAFVKALRER